MISYTTVTWYSWALAIIMFVGLPIAGFYVGRWYEHETIPQNVCMLSR